MERTSKATSTTTTYYPSGNYSITGSTTTLHIGNIATVDTTGTTTTVSTNHTDHLGSTAVVTNSSGTLTELLDYYPYGVERLHMGSSDEQRTYIGEYSDDETSYSYLNARYYNPGTGMFLSEDPVFLGMGVNNNVILLDPQSLNSYSYARNNPIRLSDPSGEFLGILAEAFVGVATIWNVVVDPILTLYSVAQAVKDPSPINIGFATADLAMLASPLPAGFGVAEDLAKTRNVVKTGENIVETGKEMWNAGSTFEQKLTNTIESLHSGSDDVLKPTQDYINSNKVEEYYNKISNGEKISPIETFKNGSNQFILDGYHRYLGGKMAGVEVPRVEMGSGSLYGTDWGKIELVK